MTVEILEAATYSNAEPEHWYFGCSVNHHQLACWRSELLEVRGSDPSDPADTDVDLLALVVNVVKVEGGYDSHEVLEAEYTSVGSAFVVIMVWASAGALVKLALLSASNDVNRRSWTSGTDFAAMLISISADELATF
ncbi:hypothetical protein K431DRAFT_289561 [Polychaeton citri CBS 116435]|uniref:Uncharacterized protein n=1 Tax=Polychaeton citri CBS 116435 TaxID=1314669 RepID=A0A9P4UKT3_9PEZI|nr:hypothetical protein K431DRAFT_289561 [Polychaeton citri CBS 116435]